MAARHPDRVRARSQPLQATYLGESYSRLARRRGDRQAIMASLHEILTATWHMLATGEI